MRKTIIKSLLLNTLILSAFSQTSQAASLQVSPTTINFTPQQQAQSVWLTNSGSQAIRGQVRLYQWQQTNGKEQLTASQSLIATPTVVNIEPGQKQLVRLVQPKTNQSHQQEQAYRLLVNELPTPLTHANGLQFLLSYSIPVFINNATDKTTSLTKVHFTVTPQANKSVLTVDNQQNQHVKLSQLTFTPTNGKPIVVAPGLLGYTLAEEKMQWPIELPANLLKSGGVFSAMVNNDTKQQKLFSYSR